MTEEQIGAAWAAKARAEGHRAAIPHDPDIYRLRKGRAAVAARRSEVLRMTREGRTMAEISAALEMTIGNVGDDRSVLRKDGRL